MELVLSAVMPFFLTVLLFGALGQVVHWLGSAESQLCRQDLVLDVEQLLMVNNTNTSAFMKVSNQTSFPWLQITLGQASCQDPPPTLREPQARSPV